MKSEFLEKKHQALLESRFDKLQLDISEYAFANLYLFRQIHEYQVLFNKDIYIKGKTRDGFYYFMPTVPLDRFHWDEIEECLKSCDFLFPLPEAWTPNFDTKKYQISYKDEDSDYLYSVHMLSTYPGRHLSGRRNLVKQFHELYANPTFMPLNKDNRFQALDILEQWQKEGEKQEPFTDYGACKEALIEMEWLKLNGLIFYVDNQPAGFVLGEALHSKTYVIHFAKALRHYKGIYQYIYQEFARTLVGKYENINLEQDLGVYDLQHAKRAYSPNQLIPKLRISLWKSKVS